MDLKRRRVSDDSTKSTVPSKDQPRSLVSRCLLAPFDVGSSTSFSVSAGPTISEFPTHMQFHESSYGAKMGDQLGSDALDNNGLSNWDPKSMLNSLSILEQKIHEVQDMVRAIIVREGQLPVLENEFAAQQQLVNADMTCIIIQLISTAGALLPCMKDNYCKPTNPGGQFGNIFSSSIGCSVDNSQQNGAIPTEGTSKQREQTNVLENSGVEPSEPVPVDDHEIKECEDSGDCENLPPGSYEVLQLEKEEILAPHTHFCLICGKGFKRDANLRMHMRGHGDEYKTPAALAKPHKDSNTKSVLLKRYSCPIVGCKRNKEHKKFQPLKTILCVKNHYKRSHCDKSYICSRCHSKKFSVIADLKTHEKHCGRDKWLCSCGTTFSRKDKLFGHVALFQGHIPVLPTNESKLSEPSDQMHSNKTSTDAEDVGLNNGGGSKSDDVDFLDVKGIDDESSYFSSMNFDCCNFNNCPSFEFSENSFPFLPAMPSNYIEKNGASSSCYHFS